MYQLNIDNAKDLEVVTINEALEYISPKLIKVGTQQGKSVYFYDADTDIVHYHTGITGRLSSSSRAASSWPYLEIQGALYHGVLYELETTIEGFNELHKT